MNTARTKTVISLAIAIVAMASTTQARAATLYQLTNGTGDGRITVSLNDAGTVGSAIYNPVGTVGAGETLYGSWLFRNDGSRRAVISEGGNASISADRRTLTSSFVSGDYRVNLTQSLVDLIADNAQTGSQLIQAYTFTNLAAAARTLDLVRYLDGDLAFDGSRNDNGGRLSSTGQTILFETDGGFGSAGTFLGIYNQGGTQAGYEVNYSDFSNIAAGRALTNAIRYDTNGDGISDSAGDVALALGARLDVAAGGTVRFTTNTIWGSGVPGQVVLPPAAGGVPEPATWATMLIGFAVVGGGLRTRRSVAFSAG